MGHEISNQGISPDPEKVRDVNKLPRPTDLKQLSSFLGLIAYFHKFIPGCSELTAPLSNLLKNVKDFVWTPKCEQNFITLKDKLTSAPVLQYPDPNQEYQLETNASDKAIGAVLQIHTPDEFKPVAYKSQMLQDRG